ncbi:hypothetical protein [Vampirovibrio chlorellavorus]|uniref:hypothetical protein n=1 Tax=Vampirovibrio chlorellavorus TaxID=758823 RepID=UPI0026F355E2|nr:hypothetical protein [Vampirovibrio chlorellavorus]
MSNNLPIMPFIVAILLLLPIRLGVPSLKKLAFTLWLVGGIILFSRGTSFLAESPAIHNIPLLAGLVAVALAIGFGKGKFVLAKTSLKNIERLNQFNQPQRPINVYSLRSWIMIALMVSISVALNVFQVQNIVRGPINLGIGFALIISSLAYLKSFSESKAAAVSN